MQRFWFFGVNCLGFLKLIVWIFFVCFELMWVGPRRVGPRRVEPRRVGPRRVGGRRVGSRNFALFFPSPAAKFVLFFPLWGSSRGILVVFEAPGRSNVHVWSSGCRVRARTHYTPTHTHTNTHKHTQTQVNTNAGQTRIGQSRP